MITFKQHLSESLSSSYPFTVLRDREHDTFHSRKFEFHDGKNNYTVDSFYAKPTNVLIIDFSANDSMRASGSAVSSPKVFGTLAKILEFCLKQYPDATIGFSSIDGMESRKRLYTALAKRIGSHLGRKVEIESKPEATNWTIRR